MKKLKKTFKETSNLIFFLFSFWLVIFSVYLFTIGFHNMDIAYNMEGLQNQFGLELVDHTMQDNYVNSWEGWTMGFKQMLSGFFMGLYGMLSMGIYFAYSFKRS